MADTLQTLTAAIKNRGYGTTGKVDPYLRIYTVGLTGRNWPELHYADRDAGPSDVLRFHAANKMLKAVADGLIENDEPYGHGDLITATDGHGETYHCRLEARLDVSDLDKAGQLFGERVRAVDVTLLP